MVEWLPSMFKALDSVPNMLKKLLQHALEALKKNLFFNTIDLYVLHLVGSQR